MKELKWGRRVETESLKRRNNSPALASLGCRPQGHCECWWQVEELVGQEEVRMSSCEDFI